MNPLPRPATAAALAAEVAFPMADSVGPVASPEELAARSREGCHESFSRLVQLFEGRIFNFLLQFTANRQDAEDLAQETFLKAYLGLRRYEPVRAFSPWLFTIARHTALNHLRARRPTAPLPDDLAETADAGDPARAAAETDAGAALWQHARRLKPKQFEVLWLHYGEGFSVVEVARIMRTTPLYTRVLLHRARQALARTLPKSETL